MKIVNKPLIAIISIIIVVFIVIITNNDNRSNNNPDTKDSVKTPPTADKKILFVASYDLKNPWSAGIKSGIEEVIEHKKNIQLKTIDMADISETSEDELKKAALSAKAVIDSWKPDVVITSDDNAAKYLIVPYFSNSDLPFVFCGINWDASKYGFPSKNVTGMIEVQLVKQLVKFLLPYAKGDRIGSIRGDTMTNRIEAGFFEKQLNRKIPTYFVSDISEWKKEFIKLQSEVDILLLGDMDTIKHNGESKESIEQFILTNTQIPTGHWDSWFKNNALITLATTPKEQGEYAAQAALQILSGKLPLEIPLVENKEATIFLNMKLAKKLNVVFPIALIDNAQLVAAE